MLTMARSRRNRDLQVRLIAVKKVKSGTEYPIPLDGEAVEAKRKMLEKMLKAVAYDCEMIDVGLRIQL
jgi:hypothetical protein